MSQMDIKMSKYQIYVLEFRKRMDATVLNANVRSLKRKKS